MKLVLNGNLKSLSFALEVLTCFIDDSYLAKTTDPSAISKTVMISKVIFVLVLGALCCAIAVRRRKQATLSHFQLNNDQKVETLNQKESKSYTTSFVEETTPEIESLLRIQQYSQAEISIEEEKENDKRLLITSNNQVFDLSTELGKIKWRESVKSQLHKEVHKKDTRIETTLYKQQLFDGNSVLSPRPKATTNGSQLGLETNTMDNLYPKRARDDINIHDPTKPVPSILNHPVFDVRGKPLRRIFIPGRGWVSSKTLALEKSMLTLCTTPNQKQENGLSY